MADRMTATRAPKTKVRYGTMAQRPAATSVPGQAYVATDATGLFGSTAGGGSTLETYLSHGSQWVLVMQFGETKPPPPPPPPPPATWTVPHPAFTTIADQGFETDLLATIFNTVGPGVTISTANPHTGTKHFRDLPRTIGSVSSTNIAANNRQIVVRFWFYLSATPNVNQILFDVKCGSTRFSVTATSLGQLKAQIGNSFPLPGLGAVSAAAWHRCDMSCDVGTDLTKATMKARLDSNTTQTLTVPFSSVDMNAWRIDLGASNTNLYTGTVDVDDIKITNNPADYPIG